MASVSRVFGVSAVSFPDPFPPGALVCSPRSITSSTSRTQKPERLLRPGRHRRQLPDRHRQARRLSEWRRDKMLGGGGPPLVLVVAQRKSAPIAGGGCRFVSCRRLGRGAA